jgi:hypothetical protein
MATVNLRKIYSRVLESLSDCFEENGVDPKFVVPYTEGHNMSDHIRDVGAVVSEHGGTGENFLLSYHVADGKGYGSADGETVGFSVSKLSQTEIKPNDPAAKKVLADARVMLNQIQSLLGDDDDAVVKAKSTLRLAEAADAAGMNCLHLGALLVNVLYPPVQVAAKKHAQVKNIHAGRHVHTPGLTAAMPDLPSGEESDESEESEGTATEHCGATVKVRHEENSHVLRIWWS